MKKVLKRLAGDHTCDLCDKVIPWDTEITLKVRYGGWPNSWKWFCSSEHMSLSLED